MKKKYNHYIIVKFKPAYVKHNTFMKFYDNPEEKNALEKFIKRTVQSAKWKGTYYYAVLYDKNGKKMKIWGSQKKTPYFKAYVVFRANFAKRRLSLSLPRNQTIPILEENTPAEAVLYIKSLVKDWKHSHHVHNIKIFRVSDNENVADIIGDHYWTVHAHWSVMREIRKLESLNQNI